MPRTAWNKRLTPEIERVIVDQYRSGLSAPEILRRIPFKTRKTVYDVLEKHGVTKRRGIADYKSYDETVFASVDTPAKAYWLGLLVTDGYVSDTRCDAEPQIGLQMADEVIIEQFRNFLGSENPVLKIRPTGDNLPMYRVAINSRRMAGDLSRYGVVPRKTFTTYLPILSSHLMSHLIRGLLDGDGTVGRRADGGAIVGFSGTQRLVAEVRMWLIATLKVSDCRIHPVASIFSVQWSSRIDVQRIARYLYEGAEVYLPRKRALLEEYL